MARKSKIVTIAAEGRDYGKNFLVTEMHPRKADKWATRALLAFAGSGRNDMPEEFKEQMHQAGLAGLAAIGIRAITTVSYELAEPLLDEMLECVAVVPDLSAIDQGTGRPFARGLLDGDLEEVGTLWTLRMEVFELHTGFSPAAFLSKIGAAAKASLNINDTSTSPKPSE